MCASTGGGVEKELFFTFSSSVHAYPTNRNINGVPKY